MADEPTTIQVRRLDAGTVGIAASLFGLSGRDAREPAMASFLSDQSCWFLGAFMGGRPVGYLYGYVTPRPDRARPRFLLYDLEVSPQHRRCGVGSALVAQLRDDMDALSARIWLVTQASNKGAMAFYKHVGAVRTNSDDVAFVFPRVR